MVGWREYGEQGPEIRNPEAKAEFADGDAQAILGRGQTWGMDVYTGRGCTAGQFVSGTFEEIERKISERGCVSSNTDKQTSG